MRVGNAYVATPDDPPLQVLEYEATGDPWRVLVACICLNRASRNALDRVWPELMRRWPTAEKMAAARISALKRVVTPLGLQEGRALKLRAMSRQFVAGEAVGRMVGCGRYAREAYRLVVEGDTRTPCDDHALEGWRRLVIGGAVPG